MKVNPLPTNPLTIKNKVSPEVEAAEQVGEGVETQFLYDLFTEMEKSVPRENPPSTSEGYYQSLLNFERANIMAKKDDGIGIKKLVVDQLIGKRGNPYGQN